MSCKFNLIANTKQYQICFCSDPHTQPIWHKKIWVYPVYQVQLAVTKSFLLYTYYFKHNISLPRYLIETLTNLRGGQTLFGQLEDLLFDITRCELQPCGKTAPVRQSWLGQALSVEKKDMRLVRHTGSLRVKRERKQHMHVSEQWRTPISRRAR